MNKEKINVYWSDFWRMWIAQYLDQKTGELVSFMDMIEEDARAKAEKSLKILESL